MNTRKGSLWLGRVALCAVVGVASAANANLITNGSFELGTDPGGFTGVGVGSTAITGWSVTSGNVDYIGTHWQAQDGSRSIDLNGSTPGGLQTSTTFATDVGAQYLVEFYMSGNPDSGPSLKNLNVSVASGATTTNSFTYDTAVNGTTRANMNWILQSMTFVASSLTSVLSFTSATTATCCWGPAIDNVSVIRVPEPAPMTMLVIVGLGLLALGAWRRKAVRA